MAKKLYEESNIQGIASAIREQNGTQNTYTVAQMPSAVRSIKTQPDLETLTATENGNYLPSANKDGFSAVTVNVPATEPDLEALTATENGNYLPSAGKDGFSGVSVQVPANINFNYDETYYMDTIGTICTLNNRAYTKVSNDPAFVAYYSYQVNGESLAYTAPVLIGQSQDAVKYTTSYDDTVIIEYVGTFEKYGVTWYYNGYNYAMDAIRESSSGFATLLSSGTYTGESLESILLDAAQDLLDIATLTEINNDGIFKVPNGYNGWGDIKITGTSSSFQLYPIFTDSQGYIDAANDVIASYSNRTYSKYDSTPAYAGYFYDGTYTNLILVSTTSQGCWYQCPNGAAHITTEIIVHGHHLYVSVPQYGMKGNYISVNGPAYKLSDSVLTTSEAQQILADDATTGLWTADHTGAYEVPEGYDGFKSFNVQTPVVPEHPLKYNGQTLPNAGRYGAMFIKHIPAHTDPTSQIVLFYADPNYVVSDTNQILCTHELAFNKLNNGPAIAIECKISEDPDLIGPILISPVEDYVKTTGSSTILGSVSVNNCVWYVSAPSNFDDQQDSPTIKTYYDFVHDLGSIPDPITNDYLSQLVQKFLDLADAKVLPNSTADHVDAYYIKGEESWNKVIDVPKSSAYYYVTTNSTDKWSYKNRSAQRVSTNTAPLVWTAAKNNTGYLAPAGYSLTDLGAVGDVITGTYTARQVITIQNPYDTSETVTIYGYGSFNGGYQNVACILTDANDNELLTVPSTSEFFGPYGSDNQNVYNSTPVELRKQFYDALLAYTSS